MPAPRAVSAVIPADQVAVLERPPGAWVIVLGADPTVTIAVRRRGWEIRDTIVVADAARMSLALLARVPVEEPTIGVQVALSQAGALWIDGCRIALVGDEDLDAEQRDFAGMGYGRTRTATTSVSTYKPEGRWPANLVFVHAASCRCRETTAQTLPVWSCVPHCLVPVLDVQTGGASRFFSQLAPGAQVEWAQRLVGGAA